MEVVLLPFIKQDGRLYIQINKQPGEPTMRPYRSQTEQAKEKAAYSQRLVMEAQLPMQALIAGVRDEV